MTPIFLARPRNPGAVLFVARPGGTTTRELMPPAGAPLQRARQTRRVRRSCWSGADWRDFSPLLADDEWIALKKKAWKFVKGDAGVGTRFEAVYFGREFIGRNKWGSGGEVARCARLSIIAGRALTAAAKLLCSLLSTNLISSKLTKLSRDPEGNQELTFFASL